MRSFAKKNVRSPPLDLIKLMALDNSKRALAADRPLNRLGRPARRALDGRWSLLGPLGVQNLFAGPGLVSCDSAASPGRATAWH